MYVQVVTFLEGVGFDRDTVGKILVRCPEIFAASVEKTLKRKVEFLSAIGIRRERIPRVIKKYPELLVCNVKQSLIPRYVSLQMSWCITSNERSTNTLTKMRIPLFSSAYQLS